MSVINRLEKLVNLSSSVGLWVAAVLLLAMEGFFLVEISGRTFASWSTLIADEYSAYFLVGLSFLGFAYAFKVGAHVRISIVTSRLSPRHQLLLDFLVSFLCLAFFAYFTFFAWNLAAGAYEYGLRAPTVVRTPMFIPQSALFIGGCLVVLQLIRRTVRAGALWLKLMEQESRGHV